MRNPSRLRLVATLAFAAVVALVTLSRTPLAAQAGSRERVLFVSAVNDKGEPVEGLGPDAFVVREDGVRREILRVSRATEPIDIALLVDNSAAADAIVTFMRETTSNFIAKMAPANQIALVGLAERPTIFVDYTSDAKRLTDAARRIFAISGSGMTLLDAITELSQGLAKRETPRAAIVALVTDGPEFTNRYYRDVVKSVQTAQATLHLVTIGQFYHSDEHGRRERSFLIGDGPRLTGGQNVPLLAPQGLDQAVQKVAAELSAQYKVVYGRPESLIPPEKVEVSSARPTVTMRGAPARGNAGV